MTISETPGTDLIMEVGSGQFFIFDSPMGNGIEDKICVKALLQRYEY